MDEITESPKGDTPKKPTESNNQYAVPGQLTVWPPGDSETPGDEIDVVPDDYIMIEIATPLQDKTYLLPVNNFSCGLHPTEIDASCVYLTEHSLKVIFPMTDEMHLVVTRSLKHNEETTTLEQQPARDPETYDNPSQNVIWIAPKTDAAVVRD